MAIVYMNDVQIDTYKPFVEVDAYEYNDTKSVAGNGNTVIIPATVTGVSVALEVTGGSGKVQATVTPLASILLDEANAVWVDWSNGEVTVTTQDRAMPVTALRQVNVSGTTNLVLRAQ